MFLAKSMLRELSQDESRFSPAIDRNSAHAHLHDDAKSLAYMMRFDGANRHSPIGMGRTSLTANFFYGNDPQKWQTDVPCYRSVIYENIYDGVNLVFRPDEGGAKYEFIIAPWANPEAIAIRYEGVDGLSMNLDALNIQTSIGEIHDVLPYSYQDDGRGISCEFALRDLLTYGFKCKGRREGAGIVIDPLIYSTFLGGSSSETIHSIKVDALGYVYVTGHSDSVDFPSTPGAYDPTLNTGLSSIDSFVAKLNPTGTQLIYATYIGGTAEDRAESIAISSSGEAYIAGYTCSDDFPTTPNSFNRDRNGTWDGFAAKLSRGGDALLYSTFIGGNDEEKAWSIAADDQGNLYVAGYTLSADFPTTPDAFDTTLNGQDAFIFKLNETGSSAIYSTLLGGNAMENGQGIAVDPSGAAFVTGWTTSADFPVSAGAFDSSYNGGRDIFITKLAPGGDFLNYSTFLGGSNNEMAAGIALDAFGNAYMAGQTWSPDFPTTPGAYDKTHAGAWDIVATKVNATGTGLVYSTFIGGSLTDGPFAISITPSGEAYISGSTYSADFPTTPDALDSSKAGDQTTEDGILLVLDASGGVLKYSTFIGGGMADWAGTVATDGLEDAYVAGMTVSSDFVTTPGAYNEILTGPSDGFIMKLRISAAPDFIDLIITPPDIEFKPEGTITNGTLIAVNATIHNAGGRNATDVLVRFHDGPPAPPNQIDSDQTIPRIPYLFGTGIASVSWLAEPVGFHDICVVVDPDNFIAESNETNNQACASVEVVSPLPDLSIAVGDIATTPPPPMTEYSAVRINATVRNIGGLISDATVARFSDGVPPSPQIDGDQLVGPIQINGETNVSVGWVAMSPGMHVICVIADPDNVVAEIDETNNMACVPVQVLSMPDLVPHDLNVTPSSPTLEGTMLRTNVTVSNEGDVFAGTFDILLFDDKNGNKSPDAGEQINISSSPGIGGHSQSGFVFDWNATPAGTHSICAYADPPPGVVTESNETNNVACVDILVQPGPILRPDYEPISPLPLPPFRVGMSSQVSLSIQVLNRGNGTATDHAIVAFYEPPSPSFQTFILSPLAPSASSSPFTAIWTSPAIPGTYFVSVDVDYLNNVSEWDETNNVYTWTIDVVSGPITSLVIGHPNYASSSMTTYIKSTTPLGFAVLDQSGFGIRNTTYTVDGGNPVNYTAGGTFFLVGEGAHKIEWQSLDWAGNMEQVDSMNLTVDDTPPATTIHKSDEQATTATVFTLTATDSGCGVNITMYRIDGGSWITYSGGFTLPEGERNLSFYSNDMLNNTEVERWLVVTVQGQPPPPEVSVNYKPILAVVFAVILLVTGVWSSKRRPWKGGKDRMAVAKAFAITSMPFVLAEGVTGIASFVTGELRIPPSFGSGTAMDSIILILGLMVAVYRIMKRMPETA